MTELDIPRGVTDHSAPSGALALTGAAAAPAELRSTQDHDQPATISYAQAGRRIGISERTIARLVDAGAPSLRCFTVRRISRTFVEAALAEMARRPVDLVEYARSWGKALEAVAS